MVTWKASDLIVVLAASVAFGGCETKSLLNFSAPDSGVQEFFIDIGASEKSHLYNLVGRWYDQDEIARLSDPLLTPEKWCEREPARIMLIADGVRIRCKDGSVHSAGVARVQAKDGVVTIALRTEENSKFKFLRFEKVGGPRATISGSPCVGGEPTEFARFPEYEILARQILAGKRCTQFHASAAEADFPDD